jgi:hypothetical protein
MYFLFLSKVPVNEPPPISPTGLLWRELPVYRSFFYISLKFLIKISLNTEIFPFSQRSQERSVPPCSPKRGPYGNRRPFPKSYLARLSGNPVKELSLEERCPIPRALFHSSFKFPFIRAHLPISPPPPNPDFYIQMYYVCPTDA